MMIVNDLNLICVPLPPHKADSKLIVDPNAVLTFAVFMESLKVVARRYVEVG